MPLNDRGSPVGREPPEGGSNRRRLVEVRCGFAEMARREAEAAEARLVQAQRTYNVQLATLKSAQAANPGAMRRLKEEAHRTFQRASLEARTRAEVEAAAAAWLADINRINNTLRTAQIRLQRELEAVDAGAAELDRLTALAEASRAMAESAAAACRAAREALAAEEASGSGAAASSSGGGSAAADVISAQATAAAAFATSEPTGLPSGDAGGSPAALTPFSVSRFVPGVGVVAGRQAESAPEPPPPEPAEPARPINYRSQDPPLIFRLALGETAAMALLVEKLSGSDPDQRKRWQACLSSFVGGVVAAAIEQGYFLFPRGHPFWGQFTREQAREVARSLAALGFHYDGHGGFADERVPGPRDLTMAAGQAGVPTVRVRYWPSGDDAAQLFREVGIDTGAVLMDRAPAATMGQLVQLLGRRADTVTDLWNEWPRVRPLLLANR